MLGSLEVVGGRISWIELLHQRNSGIVNIVSWDSRSLEVRVCRISIDVSIDTNRSHSPFLDELLLTLSGNSEEALLAEGVQEDEGTDIDCSRGTESTDIDGEDISREENVSWVSIGSIDGVAID